MNKGKLINSLAVITLVFGALIGSTTSYFFDKEISTDNVFAAGSIDLKVDNTSYFDYLMCDDGIWENHTGREIEDYHLVSLIGEECSTSWDLDDLEGNLFFNFQDLKPGDWGEDTISVHVNDNDSWLCMDIDLTGTFENGQPEPEEIVDETSGENEGELQEFLRFVWWVDDGDNVLEVDEHILFEDISIDQFGIVALADSTTNVWNEEGPLSGGENPENTRYIGKAWCFGDLSLEPIEDKEVWHYPYNDPGIRCDGGYDDLNIAQTDGITADVSFIAIQSRNNENFNCLDELSDTKDVDDD